MIRILIASDLHSGHITGLTPPAYEREDPFQPLRRLGWNFVAETVERLQPIDVLVLNGDAIDGRAEKTGGTELITTDRHQQTSMAREFVGMVGAKEIIVMAGTGYHVGQEEQWENVLADAVGGQFHTKEILELPNLNIAFRHHLPGGNAPGGSPNALVKQIVYSYERHAYGDVLPDVLIFSHRHRFITYSNSIQTAMVSPALQMGTRYADERVDGVVDYGLITFDVDKLGWGWRVHILPYGRWNALGHTQVKEITDWQGERQIELIRSDSLSLPNPERGSNGTRDFEVPAYRIGTDDYALGPTGRSAVRGDQSPQGGVGQEEED